MGHVCTKNQKDASLLSNTFCLLLDAGSKHVSKKKKSRQMQYRFAVNVGTLSSDIGNTRIIRLKIR